MALYLREASGYVWTPRQVAPQHFGRLFLGLPSSAAFALAGVTAIVRRRTGSTVGPITVDLPHWSKLLYTVNSVFLVLSQHMPVAFFLR